MIESNCGDASQRWMIDATVDVLAAQGARDGLIEALDDATAERPVALDLTDAAATAPAIQLLVAARRSLERRGAFAGWGPAASAVLGDAS